MTVRKRTTLASSTSLPHRRAGIRVPPTSAPFTESKGWSDNGYNEIVNSDGRTKAGRGKMAFGAHVAGFNSIAYGMAMVGGVDAEGRLDFNRSRKQTVRNVVRISSS